MDERTKTKGKILEILNGLYRSYQIDYCSEHAEEKASLIEKHLYDTVLKNSGDNWLEKYNNISNDLLMLLKLIKQNSKHSRI